MHKWNKIFNFNNETPIRWCNHHTWAEQLASWELSEIDNTNYFDVNVLLFTAAIANKEHMNEFNENYTKNPPEAKVPQWIKTSNRK